MHFTKINDNLYIDYDAENFKKVYTKTFFKFEKLLKFKSPFEKRFFAYVKNLKTGKYYDSKDFNSDGLSTPEQAIEHCEGAIKTNLVVF